MTEHEDQPEPNQYETDLRTQRAAIHFTDWITNHEVLRYMAVREDGRNFILTETLQEMAKELRRAGYGILDFMQNPYMVRDLNIDPENDEASDIVVVCDKNGVTGFTITDERDESRTVNF
jgi:hypothetical protein